MEDLLEQIKEFADNAHGLQRRKYSPDKYIVHPIRVMETCRNYTPSLPILAAALLHDVLEDTPVTREELHNFLLTVMVPQDADRTVQLVIELTDVYTKANFPRLDRRRRKAREVERLQKVSPEAQTIKYADIMDNVREISRYDTDFAPVYVRECKMILNKMNKGNPELYKAALQTVQNEQEQLK